MQLHMAHMFNDMFYFPQPIFVPVVMEPAQPKLQKTAASATTPSQNPAEQVKKN